MNGLHKYRFKDNPEERRFAEAWERQSSNLRHLLHTGDQHNPPDPSKRDKIVAATVIQWLGSPVGQAFLSDLGYRRLG